MAVLILPVGLLTLPFWLVVTLFAIAGFSGGFLSPSRDLLVRSITPPGRAGIVFGFVTTGFNIGGLIAPVAFGAILDFLAPSDLFVAVAIACVITILTIHAGQMRPRPLAAE
jgi:MFS family permease